MIECRRFTKRYGTLVAADGISFVAHDGLVTGLLGPNGAGKTTTLRAAAGLSRPDAGAVLVDGEDAHRAPARAWARLGVLPELVGLYDRSTVREHLAFSARLHGLGSREAQASTAAVLEELDLVAIADRRAGQLSQGQARRVALGRALVHSPANVILDEATNGLDVPGTRQVRRAIRRLAESGRAVLLSSHVMQEIEAVCDRVVVLARGRVIADGTPAELLARHGGVTLEEAFVRAIGSEEGLN